MRLYEGPCLPHCYKCSTATMILSHLSLVYVIACVVYVVLSRDVGTPFKDSLTPKQIKIKKASASVRRNIFYQGIAGSAIILFFFQPFKKCI